MMYQYFCGCSFNRVESCQFVMTEYYAENYKTETCSQCWKLIIETKARQPKTFSWCKECNDKLCHESTERIRKDPGDRYFNLQMEIKCIDHHIHTTNPGSRSERLQQHMSQYTNDVTWRMIEKDTPTGYGVGVYPYHQSKYQTKSESSSSTTTTAKPSSADTSWRRRSWDKKTWTDENGDKSWPCKKQW